MPSHRNLLRSSTFSLLFLGSLTQAHVRMVDPVPLNGDTDSNKDPLGVGNPYPCQGYIPSHPFSVAGRYTPGAQASIHLAGSATHGGGSCQISLSYDKGKSFRVVESIIGGCPLNETLDFTINTITPPGEALLAWTWFNKIGNREMYMNCAWVLIEASAKPKSKRSPDAEADSILRLDDKLRPAHFPQVHHNKHHRRHSRFHPRVSPFESLPLVFKANIPQSSYVTDDGCDVKFPHPGAVVKHGVSEHSWCGNPTTGFHSVSEASGSGGGTAARVPAPFANTTSSSSTSQSSTSTSTSTSTSASTSSSSSASTSTPTSSSTSASSASSSSSSSSSSASTSYPSPPAFTASLPRIGTGPASSPSIHTSAPYYANTTYLTITVTNTAMNSPPPQTTVTITNMGPPLPQTTITVTETPSASTSKDSYTTTKASSMTSGTSIPSESTAARSDSTAVRSSPTPSISSAPSNSIYCTTFASWRCDEGGHRLSQCNYAADWVTSHRYTWADMGVPPGTRCVLDGSGEPTFVYDN